MLLFFLSRGKNSRRLEDHLLESEKRFQAEEWNHYTRLSKIVAQSEKNKQTKKQTNNISCSVKRKRPVRVEFEA